VNSRKRTPLEVTEEEKRTAKQSPPKGPQRKKHDIKERYVIGLDLSDRTAHYAVLGPNGEDWRAEKKVQLNRDSLRRHFAGYAGSLLVMEVGAHSRWVQQVIEELGLQVFVAYAASIPGIAKSVNKHDRADARQLARLGRADCGLLRQTHHRSEATQSDLLLIRARAALVKSRSSLIVCGRGLLKSFGERVTSGSKGFVEGASESIPTHLRSPLSGLLKVIAALNKQILAYDKQIDQAAARYPAVARKLAVLLHRLWISGQSFIAFPGGQPAVMAESPE
jgi:transposase